MHRLLFALSAALSAVSSVSLAATATTPPPAVPSSTAGYAVPADVAAPAPSGAPKFTFSQCHVDGPYIAMTFDDGPSAANTPRLLDILKQRKIHATFFFVGQCVQENPEIVKRIVAEGHEIANHSWSHPDLAKMGEAAVRDQIQKTQDAIIQACGVTPKLMRPPYGAFTARQRAWANGTWGYKIILWDVDPLDWKIRNAEHVKAEILKQTVAGSIILSHDIHKTTVDAMPETLDGLLAKGFKFVTVSELLAMDRPATPKPKASPTPKSDSKDSAKANSTAATPAPAATPAKSTPVPAKP